MHSVILAYCQAVEALLLHVCAISDNSATVFVSQNSEKISMRIVRFYATDKRESNIGKGDSRCGEWMSEGLREAVRVRECVSN